jgi:UDP-glucose 4-epimerase
LNSGGPRTSVLITGAGGYLGSLCLERLVASPGAFEKIVALDVREVAPNDQLPGVHYVAADIRSPDLHAVFQRHAVDTVVHLAFVVTPGKSTTREMEYSVDVSGTRSVLDACSAANVRKIIVTSSGAAYGYHADNPQPLTEKDPLRGNEEFAYSHHKRLVEEMLARHREEHPEVEQLVLRVCTILGEKASNQITALFERKLVIDLGGATAPFVFIEDGDVAGCVLKGIHEENSGVYNVAADGTLSMREIAEFLGKPYLALPPSLLKGALWVLKRLGLSQYGPEGTLFLQHRPVLSNEKLKEEFGYTPRRTSEEVFHHYVQAKGVARAS